MSAPAAPVRTALVATRQGNLEATHGSLTVPEGWAVVESRVSGVCATDLHILEGKIPGANPPLVLGHEGAGVVTHVPEATPSLQVGDRVVLYSPVACGSCEACRAGHGRCLSPTGQLGFDLDGTYADRWTAPPESLVRIPDNVSFETAAPMGCAGITALHAVERAGVRNGDIVVVHGIGGVGLLTIQAAANAGGRVVAVADAPAKAELAEQAGAETTLVVVNTDDADQMAHDLHRAVGSDGVDHFIDFVGSATSLAVGMASLAALGTVVVGSTQGETVSVDPTLVLRKEIRLVGTLAGSRHDLETALGMASRGELSVPFDQRFPLDAASSALERIAARRAMGRNLLVW